MDQLHDNLPYKEFEKPDGIMTASYCAIQNAIPISGVCSADYYGAGYYGNMVSTDYCVAATAPTSECTAHSMYRICKESGNLAGPNCPEDVIEELSLAVVDGQIVNQPTKESCEENGKIYVDISKTCSLTDHESSSMVPNDVVIGGDGTLPFDPDSRFEGTSFGGSTTNNNNSNNGSSNSGNGTTTNGDDSDGQEFVIGMAFCYLLTL